MRDFSSVSEIPGSFATEEQLKRIYHRYDFARRYAFDKRCLEIACGSGIGLGRVAEKARILVAADLTESLLRTARATHGDRIPLVRLDASTTFPFRNRAFDLVFIFEAIYYLEKLDVFFSEAARVLDHSGLLMIGSVNPDWAEFSPSLMSHRYRSIPEVAEFYKSSGFKDLQVMGAFPTKADRLRLRAISWLRRCAARLNFIPRTLKGRQLLKHIFYGPLSVLPATLQDFESTFSEEQLLSAESTGKFKIFYLIGRRSC